MGIHIILDPPAPSARLAYVLGVLCERYGWKWTAQRKSLSVPRGARVVRLLYQASAVQPFGSLEEPTVAITPHGLLDAPSGSTRIEAAWSRYGQTNCPTAEDPLSGVFYCLALLPEYAARPTDAHGRLPAANHPLYLRGLHRIPIADRLMAELAQDFHRAVGISATPTPTLETSAATSDVDAPRALAGKPPLRRFGALARGTLSTLRTDDRRTSLADAIATYRRRRDPFDTFAYMHDEASARGLREDVFSLVGYGTRLDPGYPKGHASWREFWRKLPASVRLGVHPSYHSSERPELIAEELEALREGTDAPVTTSRQHFLRLRVPDTFRTLIECGVAEDHTLMWADADGFRAGTARAFLWYDVRREELTTLRLVPPHAMDVTARFYGGLSPKRAIASWRELAAEASTSGTAFRCIWHNSNLGPWYGWGPWREAYEASLDLSVNR